MVVDGDEQEFPADTAGGLVRSPVIRWPVRSKQPSFLMSMQQLAGCLALVALDGFLRLQVAESGQPSPAQHPADRRLQTPM